eukprot:scaffold1.g5710.t1
MPLLCFCGGAPAVLEDSPLSKSNKQTPIEQKNPAHGAQGDENDGSVLIGTALAKEEHSEEERVASVVADAAPVDAALVDAALVDAAPDTAATHDVAPTAASELEPSVGVGADAAWRTTLTSSVWGGDSSDPLLPDAGQPSSSAQAAADASAGDVAEASEGGGKGADAAGTAPEAQAEEQLPRAGSAAPPGTEPACELEGSSSQAPAGQTLSQTTVTLLCPRVSQLSRLLSCSGAAACDADGGELHRRTGCAEPAASGGLPHSVHLDAAARRLVFLPRQQLAPLARPEQALEDAAQLLLGRPGPEAVLSALLTLRCVAAHHRVLLACCLKDVVALAAECGASADPSVCHAGMLALADLAWAFPTPALCLHLHPPLLSGDGQHLHAPLLPAGSPLLLLLTLAATSRDPDVAAAAHCALMLMAMELPRARIFPLLEAFLDHRAPLIRGKASQILMAATYRRA